jgi:hypothetical protein
VQKLKLKKKNPILQYDGDTSHGSRETLNYLASKKIETLPLWPARSCDLSPIENLWAIIDRRVDRHGPTNKEELRRFVQAEWDSFPQDMIDNLVLSFEARCKKCVDAGGRTIDPKMRRK